MVHSISGCMRGVPVKLWDPLRLRTIPERLRGVFTTRRYTNPSLPLTYLNLLTYLGPSVLIQCLLLIILFFAGHSTTLTATRCSAIAERPRCRVY